MKQHTTAINIKGVFTADTERQFLYPPSMLREVEDLVYSMAAGQPEISVSNNTALDIKYYYKGI